MRHVGSNPTHSAKNNYGGIRLDRERIKQIVKFCSAIAIIVLIFLIVGIIMIKYEVEGDKNMPFNLSKIMIVSTAEGVEGEGKNKWNFDVYQNNDIYFYIDKNDKYWGSNGNIEKVRIENIQVLESPQIGEIKAYMPNSLEGRLYTYDKNFIVEEKLEYRGAGKSNPQTLEIGSQGGSALIRFSNTGIGKYSSDEDKEIVHDGSLLKKLDLTEEQMSFKISFDIVICALNHEYKANVILDMPCENLIEQGTSNIEITDMSNIIFKRVK